MLFKSALYDASKKTFLYSFKFMPLWSFREEVCSSSISYIEGISHLKKQTHFFFVFPTWFYHIIIVQIL